MGSNGASRRKRLAWGTIILAVTGCGGKSISELATDVKQAATQAASQATGKAEQVAQNVTQAAQNVTGTVSENLALAGSMELTLDAPLKTNACYVRFLTFNGRPSVLQWQSYREASQETFPSVFGQAQVSAAKVAELAGQTIPAELFVQPQQEGPVWCTQREPVQLKIVAVDPQAFAIEVVGGALVNARSGARQPVKGTLRGVLQ